MKLSKSMCMTCLLWSIIMLTGCQKKAFKTQAQYATPKNGYTLTISCQGTIPAGEDIAKHSRGIVTFTLHKQHRTFSSHCRLVAGILSCSPTHTKSGTPRWRTLRHFKAFRTFLKRQGVPLLSYPEARETKKAIEGALAGPKGTIYPSQTKVLKVLKVNATYQ